MTKPILIIGGSGMTGSRVNTLLNARDVAATGIREA